MPVCGTVFWTPPAPIPAWKNLLSFTILSAGAPIPKRPNVSSRYLYTAREATTEGTGRLVGLVRAVGDGHSIAYVQDLLVHPHAQRQGIGSALLKRVIEDFDREDIRQRLITTDVGTEHAVALYKRYGYAPVEAAGCITLACYR